ncbi:MAG: pilus assembly protein PilM [Planctomycetota bacterium]|nr:pilus assembly protein PilM [Planctomycetota bacterium]
MARTAVGIDVGSSSALAIKGAWKGGTFHVSGFAAGQNTSGDVGSGWASLAPGFKLTNARVGISGRDVNVRYSRVPEVPDWQLRNLMRFEVQEIGDQSGAEVASDFNLLPRPPEVAGEDVVLLAMSRESLLDEHIDGLAAAGGTIDAFSPNSVALYNAFVRYGVVQDDTVLIASIGAESTDVVITRGADLLFARNLSGGSKLFDDALAQRLGMGAAEAESVKIDHVDLAPGARHETAKGEKATRSVLGAAGQITSLLQSTVMFCKSQVKLSGLKLDRVLVCGGGAAVQGLPEYLSAGMGVPVERFDAFRVVDTSGLSPEEADLLSENELESVVALGLATMASDDEAYGLELLPEAVAKKRAFMGGTIWLIAAAVLGLAFLGYKVSAKSAKLDSIEKRAKSFASVAARAERVHEQTKDLVEENETLSARVTELAAVAGAGEQVARVFDALDDNLPRDFWVTRVTSAVAVDDDLGIERGAEKPLLTVNGSARPGTQSPTSQFQTFAAALQEDLDGVSLNPSFDRNAFRIVLTHFAPPAADSDDEEGEE